MPTLTNSITIDAPPGRVFAILANLEELAAYDPTVSRVQAAPATAPTPGTKPGSRSGTAAGSQRRVTMTDGKHWFEERVTTLQTDTALAFALTRCNFPIARLEHVYTLTGDGGQTTVTRVMEYTPKYGPLGRLMDAAMLRRSFDNGVKAFLGGLKTHAETGA